MKDNSSAVPRLTSVVMPVVVVMQRRLTHYRVCFFEALKLELLSRGIKLVLVYGQPNPMEMNKNDQGHIDWAVQVVNRYWKIGHQYLVFQPYPAKFKKADLVIATQENSIISNHLHLFRRLIFGTKIAFWGHGANLQSKHRNGLKERFKRFTSRKVSWWFAYTQLSADLVAATGFSRSRITVLNNAIDTDELKHQLLSVSPEETHELRQSLGFGDGLVGVFVGSLYEEKRLEFLFAAADDIHRYLPSFNLLIIGDGNERDKVKSWCAKRPWAKWVGARVDREKAAYISMAQIMLNPGLVGLGLLDSFVCEVPMITTTSAMHSPEISYLENNVNGIMTADDLKSYVVTCISLLRNHKKLNELRAACNVSAKKYTVANMVSRFVDGVMGCIDETNPETETTTRLFKACDDTL